MRELGARGGGSGGEVGMGAVEVRERGGVIEAAEREEAWASASQPRPSREAVAGG